MSEKFPYDKELRLNRIISGSPGITPYPEPIPDFKEYLTPPLTPIIILSGQVQLASSAVTLSTVTLPPQQFPLRIKKIVIDAIPPPGVSVTNPNIYNSISVSVTQNNNTVVLLQRYTNPATAFNDELTLSSEDAFFTVVPNATVSFALTVVAQATYTAFNVVLYTETTPIVD